MQGAGAQVRGCAIGKHADEDGEEHDGRGVVEQALAFEQPDKPRRSPQLAKDCHDRRRIGRCDDCAKQQCHGERHPGRERQAEADRRGGGKDGNDREGQDWRPIRRDLAQVERQRRMKEQQRQKNDEEDRSVDGKVYDRPDNVVEGIRQRRIEQEGREGADRNADDGEEHGVRQMEPLCGGLDDAGEDQEPGQDKGDARDAAQMPVPPSFSAAAAAHPLRIAPRACLARLLRFRGDVEQGKYLSAVGGANIHASQGVWYNFPLIDAPRQRYSIVADLLAAKKGAHQSSDWFPPSPTRLPTTHHFRQWHLAALRDAAEPFRS